MALPEINRGREKADKAQFLREVYDVTFTGGDARQNLWKKVIPDAKKEKVEKVNDVKAQEWLREERRRVEERAEKRWRQKFEEWQANYQQEMAANVQEEETQSTREVVAVPQPESPKFLDKEQQAWKVRAEAAEKELEELRSECKGQLNELERLYEEFRNVRREAMDERAKREKIEQHLETVAQDHEAWRMRSEHRESQLQQVRSQRRNVASRIALFGHNMLDLERQSDDSLSQAAADRGVEPPSSNEAAAALDFAGKALTQATAQNEAIAQFLASDEVLAISTTDAMTPRQDQGLHDEGQSEPGEPKPAMDEEESPPDSPGLDSPGEDSPVTVREGQSEPGEPKPAMDEEESPPDSPGLDSPGEDSPVTVREGQSEPGEPKPAMDEEESPDSPGEDSPVTVREGRSVAGDQDSVTEALDAMGRSKEVEESEMEVATALERPATVQTEGWSAASYTEGDFADEQEYATAQAVASKLIRSLSSQAQAKLAAESFES